MDIENLFNILINAVNSPQINLNLNGVTLKVETPYTCTEYKLEEKDMQLVKFVMYLKQNKCEIVT